MSKPRSAKHNFYQQQQQRNPQDKPQTKATPPKPGWLSRLWNKVVDFVKGIFRKVRDAFAIKPRNEEGRISTSWFGKWIATPVMAVMGWIGVAVVWVARWITYLALAVIVTVVIALAALLLLAGAALLAVVLVSYRVIQGVCFVIATPFLAYNDREESDAMWENYWASWHPKYWFALSPSEVDTWREFYDSVKTKYESYPPSEWFYGEHQHLWSETPKENWSVA